MKAVSSPYVASLVIARSLLELVFTNKKALTLLKAHASFYQEVDGVLCLAWNEDDYESAAADIQTFMSYLPEYRREDFLFVFIGYRYDDIIVKGDWFDNPFNMSLHRSVWFKPIITNNIQNEV